MPHTRRLGSLVDSPRSGTYYNVLIWEMDPANTNYLNWFLRGQYFPAVEDVVCSEQRHAPKKIHLSAQLIAAKHDSPPCELTWFESISRKWR